MNQNNDKSDLPLAKRFSQDLKGLFEPELRDWAAVDRKVMDQAGRTLLPRRKRRRVYWPAAAAAAITIAGGLLLMQFNRLNRQPASTPPVAVLSEDVDQNGRVDILDAFELAKMMQSDETSHEQWDLNRDGVVDQQDVDIVAQAAVSLRKDVL